ncbi:hypothetical protein CLAFUW4_04055 [Fulvia fulva]|uniref:Uncharacterized protein n=1 Tax=Passalora fulva TaxID=5499 RepID=A0A9Q8P7G9_PASFU|nr:uncharacterized protein CLAFUR5_04019 [Fulvia fulva]KAK4626819.1 hypothetical protein CLAFUR4_04041 [Fulvia fulva]KAK4628079.1 hypothetical protein CLAFUR0_04042 [Fulvia fulva]UJO16006.1 hypothetical protein CLAFUR5_04019 [Fulvia fulva]WPV14361.1 hypothetical protein CLAFUW4_04055 [Fulvia fulva]WPV28789.1 hypothetical protein CLAFUW7_04044 [Fulvia fulva]
MHIVTINDFTESEKRLLIFAWLCFDTDPKPDLHKLAGLAGMTNTGSASNAWRKIRRKLKGEIDVSPRSKSRKRAASETDGSPPKKAKPSPGKSKGAKKGKAEIEKDVVEGDVLDGIGHYEE